MSTIWKKFTALGTEIIISAVLNNDQAVLLDKAENAIKEFGKKFSRFIPDNELANFNQASAEEFEISSDMLEMLRACQTWQAFSQNTFDPTIINNLEQLGYDKSFTKIDPEQAANLNEPNLEQLQVDFSKRPRLEQLVISGNKVTKPAGLRLDFGGFGKGYIVDKISQEIFSDVKNYWLSAGGDLLACGNEIEKIGWKIAVQNPYEPNHEIFNLNTRGAKLGVATSGVFQRQGKKGNLAWHHLIDPRTGLPVDNNILAVTALANSATEADILAKTVLILGASEGLKFVEQKSIAALIFLKDGAIVFSSRVKNYL